MRVPLVAVALLGMLCEAFASPTISPDHSFSWAANLGWINWRADDANGIESTASYLAGFLYSENVGWINLGNKPDQGTSYSNSGSDYGVNIDSNGRLRGYAYGANIGWVVFEPQGDPRVDPMTGKFGGFAYSANTGWVSLGNQTTFVQTFPAPGSVDLDQDGIADAWEIKYAGNLDRFSATSDSDGDGVSDLQEFRSGTNPLDGAVFFRLIDISPGTATNMVVITWYSIPERLYVVESSDSLAADSSWKQSNAVPGNANADKTSATFEISATTQFFRVRTGN